MLCQCVGGGDREMGRTVHRVGGGVGVLGLLCDLVGDACVCQ
jgi:hypothetical protein